MLGDNATQEKKAGDIGKNIWSSLLSEVSSRSTSSKFSDGEKNIILLGDDLSGKTTLATRLQGKEDPHRGSALEYQYMEIQDEDVDEKAICGIWIMEGNRSYRSLLHFALPKERFSDSIIVLTLDMSQPWNMMESLDTWTTVIREHIDQSKISAEELKSLEEKLIQDFQKYIDPSEVTQDDPSIVSQATSRLSSSNDPDSEQITIPLGENTLTCNLGIQLIVVCTKCDFTEKLEKDNDYKEEHFDFIQHRLRTFCLKYGAALFYTSVKDNKNTEILHRYLLHKLYGFPFDVSASVVDKDAVFVPSGWDTEKKISIISDNFTKVSVNDAFEDVIARPIVRKPLQEMKEITAEDEQIFLTKAQTLLSAPPAGPGATRASVPNRTTADANRLKAAQTSRASLGGLSGASAPKIKPDPNKPAQSNERVLANFFNSLLNKKPGSPASPAPSDKTAADLARLQQQANIKQRNSPSGSKQPTSGAS
uniref:cytoplasmic dynein 1 light intermediate chain 2-like n=1 Tax=Styela clava TaxID=7725 RepID=UPI001939EBDB|nr:cytoplasmic dynein 1 light intermediate chain 2-like [Styela clava]